MIGRCHRSWLGLALGIMVLGGGCRRSADQHKAGKKPAKEESTVTVVALRIRQISPAQLRVEGIDDRQVKAHVRGRLSRCPALKVDLHATGPGYSVELGWGIVPAPEDPELDDPVAAAMFRATAPTAADLPTLEASVVNKRPSNPAMSPKKRMISVLDRALDDLVFQAELVRGSAARLTAALSESDRHRLAAAVGIAAHRRLRTTVPALIKLLGHDDLEVSDRAVGALVASGDRRAVRPLTEMCKFDDTATLAKVIDAIGTLGGQNARDYLQFVASGHEDPDIRDMATAALGRMDRAPPVRGK